MSSVEHDNMVGLVQSIISGEDQSIEVLRSAYDQLQQSFPMADDVECEEIQIEHIYTDWVSVPESRDDSVIMYLHGGGYVIGSKSGYREFASRIARACKARVLVVEYRLAPEHVFPAALDDAVMAYRWLLNQGINSENITVFGDSAGGGLTLATLVALRDTGDALPKCAVCFSAWADLAGTGDSGKPGAVDDPVMNQEALDSFRDLYVGKDTRNPLASPLYANLSGLPRLCLFAGTREVLIDDSRRMAENAKRDGVEVTLTIGEGMMHVWPVFPMPESIEVLSEVAAFVEAR